MSILSFEMRITLNFLRLQNFDHTLQEFERYNTVKGKKYVATLQNLI